MSGDAGTAARLAAGRSPDEVAALALKVRALTARLRLLRECPTPADLAARMDSSIVRTPAFELVSQRWAETIRARDGRLTISVPPQQFKTLLSRWAIFWALLDNPDRRVVFASYGMALARTSGRIIRSFVETYGAPYGLTVDRSHADAADWQLAGQAGGVLCAGVGSSLTGRPSDLMVLDDLLAGQAEADSDTVRGNVHEWWETVARTRMAPGAPAVAIGTRWHEQDVLSRFIDAGWDRINIPAQADGETADTLERAPGEYLVSTRGTTPADWERIRADVGERAWAALYQGRPAPLAGGIFQRAAIDAHRAPAAPEDIVATTIAVDPADTGEADEAGMLVGSRAADGTMYVRADLSGHLSQGEWGRRACLAAVRFEADTIHQERNLGMGRALRDAWAMIVRQGAALAATSTSGDDDRIGGALAALVAAGDHAAAEEAQLREVLELLDEIRARPSSAPCRITAVTPRMSKYVRAHAVAHLYETGRARHVGSLPLLEWEMTTWQPGQKSPNRLDTLAHLLTQLDVATGIVSISVPRRGGASRVPASTAGPTHGFGRSSATGFRPTVVRGGRR